MSNYTKSTNFASKDSLPTGNASKIVKGTEINTEFDNIATAVATKADSTSPTLVTPALGTPSSGVMTNVTGLPLTTGVTGTLPVANGGTGVTTSTGSGANVLGTSPTIATPTITGDATISGLTVGKGGGAVSTNTAVGASALGGGSQSGGTNAAFGNNVLAANTSGSSNTAMGYYTLASNTTGGYNVAIGGNSSNPALFSNTTGSYNTALGSAALQANTTASNNTAVGYQAGYSTTTSAYNSFFGKTAGYSNITGVNNTFIGGEAGYSTTGSANTFIGRSSAGAGNYGAGYNVTTGSNNTIIGGYNGNQGGLDIRTSSNYIVLSDGDGNPRGIFDSSGNLLVGTTTIGAGIKSKIYYATATAGNFIGSWYSDSGSTENLRASFRADGGLANYSGNNSNLSDRREKTNFSPAGNYLEKICAIPIQTYNFIYQNLAEDSDLTLGAVAQDVQAVAPELVTESNWGTEEEPKMRLSIYQTDLQYALMKSIQELKAINDTQAETINALTARIVALEAK
jgi:hypothetical protein